MISAKSRYALKIMIFLTRRRGELTSVSMLSEGLGISHKYLEQLMTILKRGGYVEAVRGAYGGYRAVGSPEQYRVLDILRLMEGNIEPVECIRDRNACAVGDGCALKSMWEKLWQAEKEVLENYTVAALAYGDD